MNAPIGKVAHTVIPALLGRYVDRRTGGVKTVIREWGNHRGVFTVALQDERGFEWVGSVNDFYNRWIHEAIASKRIDS